MSLTDHLAAHASTTLHSSSQDDHGAVRALASVCPKAPAGMAKYGDQLEGNAKWFALVLFAVVPFVCIGAILLGKALSMRHVSQGGAIGLLVVVAAAILYVGFGGILHGIIGSGC